MIISPALRTEQRTRQGSHDPRSVSPVTALQRCAGLRLLSQVFTCTMYLPYPLLLMHYPFWGPQLALLSSKVPTSSEEPDREHVKNKFPYSFLRCLIHICSVLGTLPGQDFGSEGIEDSTQLLPIGHHTYTQTPHRLITTEVWLCARCIWK